MSEEGKEKDSKYRKISIPGDLINQVEKEIKVNRHFIYRSHSEFVIDATRRWLVEIREIRHKLNESKKNLPNT
ncbi:MAG: hypothetical protein GF353_24750 [Candidatus Lokiarchaeota archaeon]|nr:hypothetical protein [Candidatus Lokiarchaeota archaeon]